MSFQFEWDGRKDALNRKKHGVSFDEAATAFGDPRSLTVSDPEHSLAEERFVLLGLSYRGRLLVVVHTERLDLCASSALAMRPERKHGSMAKSKTDQYNGMKKEYEFSSGVRGKDAKRFAQGSNVVVLDPVVARLFRDAGAVNRALRAIAEVAPTRARK